MILEHRDYRIIVGTTCTGRTRWAICPASDAALKIRDTYADNDAFIETGHSETAGDAIRAARAAIDNIDDGPPPSAIARLLKRIAR